MFMCRFNKKKFLALPSLQQHKKCAEMLRAIYEEGLQGRSSALLDHYQEVCQWMGLSEPRPKNIKSISDRYHSHLKAASQAHKEHRLLPTIRKGDRETPAASLGVSVFLDHIRSAHNVGSIVRTTEAMALGTLYFSCDTPFIDHKQVKDASMGASEWVECKQGTPLQDLPRPIIALEATSESIGLYDYLFPETFTLVVGNEEYGCSDATLAMADVFLEIPLFGRKNSLNVANAFSIAAGEIQRQHMIKKAKCSYELI